MTARLEDLTPEQLARRRQRQAPKVQLGPDARQELAYLAHMRLWPKAQVAATFGVHPKSVYKAMEAFPRHP